MNGARSSHQPLPAFDSPAYREAYSRINGLVSVIEAAVFQDEDAHLGDGLRWLRPCLEAAQPSAGAHGGDRGRLSAGARSQ
jgi:hypothetical protein